MYVRMKEELGCTFGNVPVHVVSHLIFIGVSFGSPK